MEKFNIYISVIFSCGFVMLSNADSKTTRDCGGYAADVMFLLDTSSSIEPGDFIKQLNFTQDVVKIFDIGRERTKVGLALFSSTVYPEFDLDDFNSKGHIVDRIAKIRYRGGRTNTAEALSFIREKIFTLDRARKGAPRIAIILTDGLSNFPDDTKKQAKELLLNGVTVFVIGIGGDVDQDELNAIATSPASEHVFHVTNFDALASIKNSLAYKTCEVKYVEPIIQQDILDQSNFLGDRLPCTISVAYGGDLSSASSSTSRKILSFFTLVNDRLQDQLLKVRSVQLFDNCPVSSRTPQRKGKSYSPLLRNMRMSNPASLHNIRNPGKAMSILLIDTSVDDLVESMKEIMRARFKRIDTFVVIVGTETSRAVLERLLRMRSASPSFQQHVFAVKNYDKLEAAISPMVESIKNLKCR